GARIRVARIARALRRRHDVALLSLEAGDVGAATGALGVPVTVHAAQTRRGVDAVGVAPATTEAVWRAVHLEGTFSAAAAAIHRRRAPVPTVVDEGCVYHLSYARAARLAPTAMARVRGLVRTWRLR